MFLLLAAAAAERGHLASAAVAAADVLCMPILFQSQAEVHIR
jgi:hypothetical protein